MVFHIFFFCKRFWNRWILTRWELPRQQTWHATSLLNIHHNGSLVSFIFIFYLYQILTWYISPKYSSQHILLLQHLYLDTLHLSSIFITTDLFIILGDGDDGGVCTGCTHFMVFFMVLKNFTVKFLSTQSVVMFCFVGRLFVTSPQCSSFHSFSLQEKVGKSWLLSILIATILKILEKGSRAKNIIVFYILFFSYVWDIVGPA